MTKQSKLPIHESVRILLINPQNEILLMCADDPSTTCKEGIYRGKFWFLIGGKMERQESLAQTAFRELKEETGLDKQNVTIGPKVWYGEFQMILSGQLMQLKQHFIVMHTKNSITTLKHLTPQEKKVVKSTSWFSLKAIRESKEPIYPTLLVEYLPDILKSKYPHNPLWIDLDK